MRAWTLDMFAIVVGVVLAEVVIQLVVTPTISARMGKASAKDGGDGNALPW